MAVGDDYETFLTGFTLTTTVEDYMVFGASDFEERRGEQTATPPRPDTHVAATSAFAALVDTLSETDLFVLTLIDFEDVASGNFAGSASTYAAAAGSTQSDTNGNMSDGTADGTLALGGLLSLEFFNTGNAVNADPSVWGDDPGIATNPGNDADRGYNITPEGSQYLEVLPGEATDGGLAINFDQSGSPDVFGFGFTLMGREDGKRDVYLDVVLSNGTVFRSDTDTGPQGGEQFFSFVLDPDEEITIDAIVLYEPAPETPDASARDIFAIDDLAFVLDEDNGELTVAEYLEEVGIESALAAGPALEIIDRAVGTVSFAVDEAYVEALEDAGFTDIEIQWFENGVERTGEDGDSLVLISADEGERFSYELTYESAFGVADSVEGPNVKFARFDKYVGSGDAETIIGSSFDERINGRGGDDFLLGMGGEDRLRGNQGRDILEGGGGRDTLFGGGGKDILTGESGSDTLKGGRGKDRLEGGAGDDALSGGQGADVFYFDSGSGDDDIVDYQSQDTILISADAAGVFSAADILSSAQVLPLLGGVRLTLRDGSTIHVEDATSAADITLEIEVA